MKHRNLLLLTAVASLLAACASLQSGGEDPAQLTAAPRREPEGLRRDWRAVQLPQHAN